MNSEDTSRCLPLFVAGPTASGKSATAVEIASRIGGEIVNADAFQLYRGLDILTAKPTSEEMARVPHHLFSVLDSTTPFSAAQYEALAKPVIDQIAEIGRVPIIVGGSGLYLKSLTHGLSPLPPGDPKLRSELALLDHDTIVRRLLTLDPDARDTVDLANPRYVTRALEICILTGKPASLLQSEWNSREVSFQGACLQWDREILYQRINERTVSMLSSGAIEEVRSFSEKPEGASLSKTAVKAIGIREIRDLIDGDSTLEETTTLIQQATRKYAKRQMTWFRRESGFDSVCASPGEDASSLASKVLAIFPNLNP